MPTTTSRSPARRLRASLILFTATIALSLMTSCGRKTDTNATGPSPAASSDATRAADNSSDAASATVTLLGTEGNKASGTVTFTKTGEGVRVVAEIKGLSPGEHGFHIHENGDCSGDGTAAGGHFNPTNKPHGDRDSAESHVGDLGNITADASGSARLEFVAKRLELSGPNSIVGRALIVHGGRDDLKSQPSGDAGPRVACGVITAGTGRM